MIEQGRDLMQQNRVAVKYRMNCTMKCDTAISKAVNLELCLDIVLHNNREGTSLDRCLGNFSAPTISRQSHGKKEA